VQNAKSQNGLRSSSASDFGLNLFIWIGRPMLMIFMEDFVVHSVRKILADHHAEIGVQVQPASHGLDETARLHRSRGVEPGQGSQIARVARQNDP